MISDCPGLERLMLMGHNALKDLLDEHLHVDVADRDRVRTILRGLSMTAIEVLGNMEQAWAKEDSAVTILCTGGGSGGGLIARRHYRSGALCVCGHLYAVHEPGPHCQTIDGCTSCACQIFDPTVTVEATP